MCTEFSRKLDTWTVLKWLDYVCWGEQRIELAGVSYKCMDVAGLHMLNKDLNLPEPCTAWSWLDDVCWVKQRIEEKWVGFGSTVEPASWHSYGYGTGIFEKFCSLHFSHTACGMFTSALLFQLLIYTCSVLFNITISIINLHMYANSPILLMDSKLRVLWFHVP